MVGQTFLSVSSVKATGKNACPTTQVPAINAFIYLQNGQRPKVISGLTMTTVTPKFAALANFKAMKTTTNGSHEAHENNHLDRVIKLSVPVALSGPAKRLHKIKVRRRTTLRSRFLCEGQRDLRERQPDGVIPG